MKDMPYFHTFLKQYPNRKNIKESLKTSNLHQALERMEKRLTRMKLFWSDKDDELMPIEAEALPIRSEPGEYFHNLHTASHLDAASLEDLSEIQTQVFMDSYDEASGPETPANEALIVKYTAQKTSVERLLSKEDQKLNPAPHPYSTSLTAARKLLTKEYEADHRDRKVLLKLNKSVEKFLVFLDLPDVSLENLRSKTVKDYVRFSRDNQIPKNTFSSELGHLIAVFENAQQENYINQNLANPFRGHKLKGFKKQIPKAYYSTDQVELLATHALVEKRFDILTIIAVSFYTGMRSSELFDCKLKSHNDILYFLVAPDGGKTVNSNRNTPLHASLKKWLYKCNLMPEIDEGFAWDSPTAGAFNKIFNRFNETHFIKKHNIDEKEGTYSHHSFRHGLINSLFDAGLTELNIADIVGHGRDTVAQTETGKTYLKLAKLPKLHEHVNLMPTIELPTFKYDKKWN